MLCAPYEFFEVGDGQDLMTAMQLDIAAGYNLIKFYDMEFWTTRNDPAGEPELLKRMRHYSCFDVLMYRAFPNLNGVEIETFYGHRPQFSDVLEDKPSPRIYISRHYKLRSTAQALGKTRRIQPTQHMPRVNSHYTRFTGAPDGFVIPVERLHRYDDDHNWQFDCVFNGNRPKRGKSELDAGYYES